MTVALVANIARPISSAISTAFSADSYGMLSSYGLLGASANPDAVIEALFANSEVGAWYDPSDLTTMFQDYKGVTPVTADGQTVGLILDKSQGVVLGPELVTNGDFGSGVGWATTANAAITGGACVFTSAVAGNLISRSISGTANATYQVSATSSGITGGTWYLRVRVAGSTSVFGAITSDGSYTFRLPTTFTANSVEIVLASGSGSATFDNFSVKEIAGNHAYQSSAASRPLKTSTGAADWTNYDAVDDVLNITFQSSLGSDCTVCRANVGGAPTILTGQTIGTSYADSTDNAGLIIINRALTGQETTDVTAWLLAKGATA